MVDGFQVRADFGTLEQLSADQGTHAGSVQEYRDTLRTLAQQALTTLDGGMGTEEHQACMRKVDELIDEHINATHLMQRSTGDVHDTFRQGGQSFRTILGGGV
jgi:hypothetical protein